jgi:hypothetical protein
MKNVVITSPAGSGQTYSLRLIRHSFPNIDEYVRVYGSGHERQDVEVEIPQLVILRNPYDAVASGAERWLNTSNHKPFTGRTLYDISDEYNVKDQITCEARRYFEFLDGIEKLNHVKIAKFRTLTHDPELFNDIVQSHFELNDKVIRVKATEEVIKKAFDSLVELGEGNRIPREKSESRLLIDNWISEMFDKDTWDCWGAYMKTFQISI